MKNNVIALSRKLRRKSTPSEKIFWENVRNRKINNHKFLRQYPIPYISHGQKRYFIADFFCKEKKLIIEIDGNIHNEDYQKEYDLYRDEILTSLGLTTVRFSNTDVMTNLEVVLDELRKQL